MSFTRPLFHPLWATSGSAIDPGLGKRNTGWTALEKPAHTTFNWIDREQSDFIEYLETATLDSESLWKLGAFKASDRMTVAAVTGLTGTLYPKDATFLAADVGAIYNATGKKTTWSGQDLINASENTHLYTASVDTYIAYNDALRTFEYNEVPNDDPAPTPTAGFLNFQRVVTDGVDITGANDTLPIHPPFATAATFAGLGVGTITATTLGGFGNPALVVGNDDGTISDNQWIKLIAATSHDTRVEFHGNNVSTGPISNLGYMPTAGGSPFQIRVTTDLTASNLRTAFGLRSFVGADFPIQLPTDSLNDDYLTVADLDGEKGHNYTAVGRITVDGSGGTVEVFNINLAAGHVALVHVTYTERTQGLDFQMRKYYLMLEGGTPTTSTTIDAAGVNEVGFTGDHIVHVGATNVAEIHVENTGSVARRYNFKCEVIVDREGTPS